jgi:hypothetical protein
MSDVARGLEVGDLIRWYDREYPYFVAGAEYYFEAPKYGIVVEIHIPNYANDYWEDYYDLGIDSEYLPWPDDIAWAKILTIGTNLEKRYIYLQFDEGFEILSKIKKSCKLK